MKPLKKTALALGLTAAAFISLGVLFILFLTLIEYRPAAAEEVPIEGGPAAEGDSPAAGKGLPKRGDLLRILTLNIGYGALSADQDFFMDGGKTVRPAKASIGQNNLESIGAFLREESWDIVLLQEVDARSHRSYYANQFAALSGLFPEKSAAYAENFNCLFIPFPWPPIGMVHSGIATLNSFAAVSAERISLPVSFSWPIRIAQMKRCLLVERIPVEGSTAELVLINLHLEAYDSGEGKTAQTRVLTDLLISEYERGNYCIAGGDFNQTFPGMDPALYPVKKTGNFIPGALPEDMLPGGWQYSYDPSVPTSRLLNQSYPGNPEDIQLYVIDGFILSPNIELRSVKTLDLDFRHTDHNPVAVELVLN